MDPLLLNGQHSERLRFRKLQATDFDYWLPFHQDPRSSQYWIGLPANPVEACKQQFDSTFERYKHNLGGMNALISLKDQKMVGLSGLLVQEVDGLREVEIAYSILPQYWRKGFASEAAKTCRDFAKDNALCESLISIISTNNLPSQKVATSIGMKVDKTTEYHGNKVYIFRIKL